TASASKTPLNQRLRIETTPLSIATYRSILSLSPRRSSVPCRHVVFEEEQRADRRTVYEPRGDLHFVARAHSRHHRRAPCDDDDSSRAQPGRRGGLSGSRLGGSPPACPGRGRHD